MRSTVVMASVAVILSVAGCAAPAPPPPMAATVPTPALASAPIGSGGVDGVYRPPSGGATGNTACGTTRFTSAIRVVNGTATLQTATGGQIQGPVAPDGSLSIEAGRSLLRGQFAGDTFTGTYTRGNCNFALAYKK